MKDQLADMARRILPLSARRQIVRYTRWPPVGWVRFGSLRRVKPISREWGLERGRPIDRYYIERFLATRSGDIAGHVLEIGDDTYTRKFGGDKVIKSDVLHVAETKPRVTIIADLTKGEHLSADSFDCVILTQTLQAIYDVAAAIGTVYRILKPGGIALATVPGISKISRYDMDRWGYYWSFTSRSIRRLFETAFPSPNVQVSSSGNVLAAISFLHGLSVEELKPEELAYADPDYELVIEIRAVKPSVNR
jgi:SAM-dependent methyltransferase